jgi:hypothetical protein
MLVTADQHRGIAALCWQNASTKPHDRRTIGDPAWPEST